MFCLWLTLSIASAESPSAADLAPIAAPSSVPSSAAPSGPPAAAPLPGFRAFPGLVGPNDPHWDLETIYLANDPRTGVAAAKAKQAANPSDPEVYWHIVRFMYDIGEAVQRDDTSMDKDAHYSEMVAWADKGLAIAPGHPHLLFARGVAMGRLGTTRGVLSSLWMAKTIETSWITVTQSDFRYATANERELLPCDAHQALSIFYRLVPESWLVGMIAGTRGDIAKSVEHAMQANACAPNVIRNLKELGASSLCYAERRGDPVKAAEGRAALERVLTVRPNSNLDQIDHKHARRLLDDPSLACGYSRDGQQQLDESQLQNKQ